MLVCFKMFQKMQRSPEMKTGRRLLSDHYFWTGGNSDSGQSRNTEKPRASAWGGERKYLLGNVLLSTV